MGLFGPSRTKSIWDIIGRPDSPIDPGMTSDGGYDPSGPMSIPEQASPNDPASQPKPGFFGAGGVGRGIAGSIGDFLLQNAHMAPVYAPAVQHQRDIQDRAQQFQMEQQGALDTWKKQQEYKRANPDPMANDTERDYQLIYQRLGPEAAQKFLENKTIPPMMAVDVQQPNGAVSREFYPRGGLPGQGASSGPPPAAVQYLKQHPESAAQFDQKYGQGASQSIVGAGGPTGSRSGGFLGGRRPR